MSPKGNHTIAIINGTENYDHLKMSLSDIIKDAEELKSVTINGYILCCFPRYPLNVIQFPTISGLDLTLCQEKDKHVKLYPTNWL